MTEDHNQISPIEANEGIEMADNSEQNTSANAFRDFVADHPLASTVGAVIVGVAIGSLIPRSQSEREALRNTGAKLREKTHEAVSAAKEAGKTGLEDAGITMDEAKLQVRDLVRRASEAAHNAGEAARDSLGVKN